MRMLQALCCGAVGVLLIAQARPVRPGRSKSRADGGTVILGTDPPGRLRPAAAAAADGGVPQADAGPDATQRQIQELRARVDLLERQLAQSQQQGQQLQQISAELQQLRQQVADAESQRQAAEQQRESRRQQVQSSVDALYQAQSALAGGSSDIAGALDQAQSSLSGQALRDVQAARAALQNRDLAAAWAWLSAAISDAQQYR